MSILTRQGSKGRIFDKILPYFPKHDIYMEPFFGAGGMFFNKPKAKFNFLNDNDDDVYNLFRQVIDNKDGLVKLLQMFPVTNTQFKGWARGKREKTDVLNALRFLVLSNFSLYGDGSTLELTLTNKKRRVLKNIDNAFLALDSAYFTMFHFVDFFKNTVIYRNSDIKRSFIYANPPYLSTGNNYKSSFTKQDSIDLFDVLEKTGIRFAMSEFDNDFILGQASKRGLNVIRICDRCNIKNRRTEILVTNYKIEQVELKLL
jgi:DNA adenine methylase